MAAHTGVGTTPTILVIVVTIGDGRTGVRECRAAFSGRLVPAGETVLAIAAAATGPGTCRTGPRLAARFAVWRARAVACRERPTTVCVAAPARSGGDAAGAVVIAAGAARALAPAAGPGLAVAAVLVAVLACEGLAVSGLPLDTLGGADPWESECCWERPRRSWRPVSFRSWCSEPCRSRPAPWRTWLPTPAPVCAAAVPWFAPPFCWRPAPL